VSKITELLHTLSRLFVKLEH